MFKLAAFAAAIASGTVFEIISIGLSSAILTMDFYNLYNDYINPDPISYIRWI